MIFCFACLNYIQRAHFQNPVGAVLRKNELCTALGSVPSYTSTIKCFVSKTISTCFKINNKSNVYFQNPVEAITLFPKPIASTLTNNNAQFVV